MKKKLRFFPKLTTFFLTPLVLLPTFLGVHWLALQASNQPVTITQQGTIQAENSTVIDNGLIPLEFSYKTPLITEIDGPIISYGSKITAIDWFAAKRWELDLLAPENKILLPENLSPSTWVHFGNRSFLDWSLDRTNHHLWVLTNANKINNDPNNVTPQNIIQLDSRTGEVLNVFTIPNKPSSHFDLLYKIATLKSGNVLVYGKGLEHWEEVVLLNPTTGRFTNTPRINDIVNHNVRLGLPRNQSDAQVRLHYLIPIDDNVNVGVFAFRKNRVNANGGDNNLYLMLLDDQFQKINITSSNSPWGPNTIVKIDNPFDRNNPATADQFSQTLHNTLDNRTYFTAYEKFFVFFPKSAANGEVSFQMFDLRASAGLNNNQTGGNSMNNNIIPAVSSYTVDTNENVFLKFFNDSNIYKLTITGRTPNDTSFALANYYNLQAAGSEPIRDNGKDFVLFNVEGSTGSIMLIKAKEVISINDLSKDLDQAVANQYGLAAAIVPNRNQPDSGDSLGLLNTAASFQKAADFTIDQNILNVKLPSEITRRDITHLNGGFFTQNETLDPNGNLMYLPFIIKDIDDAAGSFTVVVNVDQIPWYSNRLPAGSTPRTIQKTFTNSAQIASKISWLPQTNLDYDFLNTLPSKVTNADLMRLDPFQVNINSQPIFANQQLLFPKKSYQVTDANDETGQVTIQATYQYVPLGVTFSEQQVLTTTSSFTYQIFKNSDPKQFFFVGQTANSINQAINIGNIPQLKQYQTANLLPTFFTSPNNNVSLTDFVNQNTTRGYPLSRLTFSLIPDDNNGRLTLQARFPADYYGANIANQFEQSYVGFNQVANYTFAFNTNQNQINNIPFANILPSNVTEGDVINNLVVSRGYNTADFAITLAPNDENGTLLVNIRLSDSYPRSIGVSGHGFNNYVATFTFQNFMNTNQFNEQFTINFKSDDDASLLDVKKLTPLQIQTALGTNDNRLPTKSLVVGNQTYLSLNDLLEKVFVANLGSLIPKNWHEHAQTGLIRTTLTFDNQAGTINFFVQIAQSLLKTYPSDLNVVISYSGFVKGNAVVTNDNLSFAAQNTLPNIAIIPQNLTASQFKAWLNDKANLTAIFLELSGEYQTFVAEDRYTLSFTTNDVYNLITVTITFPQPTDPNSLTTYSVQYQFMPNF